jgi:hypothetical protein
MIWRKWLVRGGGYTALGGLVACGLAWVLTTQPEVVRQIVLDRLGGRFVHVAVSMQSAHARLLGGITVHELRLSRNDGLDNGDFVYVPQALIYPDKEKLFDGQVGLRQVELLRPQFRIVRERNGHVNVQGILGPTDLTEPLPAIVVRQGSITIEDRGCDLPGPALEIRDLELTIINDPLPILQIEGTGKTDVLGPVKVHARLRRDNGAGQVDLELPDIPIDSALAQRLSAFAPTAATHLRHLDARGKIEAHLTHIPESPNPLAYEIHAHLHDGHCTHTCLPGTLEAIDADAHYVNGRVPEARLTASFHPAPPDSTRNPQVLPPAQLTATIKDLALPPGIPDSFPEIDNIAREVEVKVDHLTVTPPVLRALPSNLKWLEEDYAPSGPLSLTFACRRAGPGPRVECWSLRAEGMRACSSDFPYPVSGVKGLLEIDTSALPDRRITLDLEGMAGECPVKTKGWIRGEKKTSEVSIDITGEQLRLDQRVMNSLSPHPAAQRVVNQFLPAASRTQGLNAHPMGWANFKAELRRQAGHQRLRNVFTIDFLDSEVLYDQFPYPLEHVTGRLILHPDHWECCNARGSRSGGTIFVDAFSRELPPAGGVPASCPAAGGPPAPEEIHVKIRGQEVKLDSEFEQALTPARSHERKPLQNAWHMLALTGRMNFAAEVIDHPDQPQDIAVGVEIQGCALKPTFFPYALEQVSGSVQYARNRVHVTNVKARHGSKTELGLKWGLLQLRPGGGFITWLRGIESTGLVPDEQFLAALPEPLRKGMEPLGMTEPLVVQTELTIDAPGGTTGPLKVWWDGSARLSGAHFRTGIEATDATGEVACKGHFDGQLLHGLSGNVYFERAKFLGQPLTNLSARIEVQPTTPESLRLRQLKADVFGGTVGGEALVRLGPVFGYELWLEALRIQLDQFGKHNLGPAASQAQLSGPARAALYLQGEGTDLLGLKGMGQVDVADGRMGRLPLLLGLLKAFGLRVPDRTAFEKAHLGFTIEGPQIQVRHLDLLGNAINLHGEGTVDLDGANLNLDFSATPGEFVWVPPGLDPAVEAIYGQILRIKMRGQINKPNGVRFEKELVPAVAEPIRKAMGKGS